LRISFQVESEEVRARNNPLLIFWKKPENFKHILKLISGRLMKNVEAYLLCSWGEEEFEKVLLSEA